MKNSYGIYNSEAECIEAKIHTIRDIIEYLKNGPVSISNYTKAPNRKVFQSIFNSATQSVAGIDKHDLEDLIAIYCINFEANQAGALLPLLDYYNAVNNNNALWAPTSEPIIMYFRWLFPKLASYKTFINSSDDLINSFIRTITDIASEKDPKFGVVTQALSSFLKNEATNPAGCIRELILGKLHNFTGDNPSMGIDLNILADFFDEFRNSFEYSILPIVDGTSYSPTILSLLTKTVLEKDWADTVNKFGEVNNAEEVLSIIYALCLVFYEYAESLPTKNVSTAMMATHENTFINTELAMCVVDYMGKHAHRQLESMAYVIFDYVNKYRKIPREGNIDIFVEAILSDYTNFITKDIGHEYDELCASENVPYSNLGKAIEELDTINNEIDHISTSVAAEPHVRTIINGIGKPTIIPATEASKYEKEGKGSASKAAMVQTGEKARRNLADTANDVKNGVYIPYKKYKNAAGTIDNQLAKITKGLKDAVLNTNSSKFREEVIAGKTYSPLKILAKVIGGYAVFCTSKVLFIVGLIGRYYLGKKCKARERRKAIVELEGEIKILDEKIADAAAAGDNKAKYELMRTRNAINSTRDSIISAVNRNPDKNLESTKRALFNVEVNTNGKK